MTKISAKKEYPIGSEWRKWDLHIHSPYSICQEYGSSNFDDFIEALENLPSDVKVIGINDYYFIDGYEEVMKRKKAGKLKNIEKIFPILEFRIDTFGSASESKFQKINLHILFNLDEDNLLTEIKKVKEEFINQIHLSRTHSTQILSKENLTEYSSDKTLKSGFTELIPSTEEVFKLLSTETWKERVFILLGYIEWNNLEKQNQLKNEKQRLYNLTNAFFTASESDDISKKEEVLHAYGETKPLLHSLDIHEFSRLKEGYKCFTWIKADPTFDGLRQIIFEPEERLFIGQNPLILERVQSNKTKYIHSLKIDQKKQYNGEQGIWFKNVDIEFNKELIAIVGNKGSGKSAMSDILGLLGDTHNAGIDNRNLSFLNNSVNGKKFRKKGFSENFEATMEWEDKKITTKSLNEDIDITRKERVKYLPQNYFETLTNDLEGQGFEKTLKSVIFLHIQEAKRFSKETFEELLEYKSQSIEKDISILLDNIKKISTEIIS